jgi:hypothetical protein
MSINKIDSNLPTTTKIEDLNDMIVEVNGKVEQGKFNKNEIDQIFTDLGLDRKFSRDTLLGNSISTYTGWSHLHAETGYSIWKYTISDYTYNANNQLYFDDKLLTFRGKANSETALTYDLVYVYDITTNTWNNYTSEAGTETGTEFEVDLDETGDYLYLGYTSTFAGAKFEFHTRGSNYTLKFEYFNGSWIELTSTTNNLVDNTSDFESDGAITWTVPSSWIQNAVNGQTKYWIRISSTTIPVTIAKVYYLIPYNSVKSLLALSSSQVLNEEWAWCSFGSSVYVTIRHAGNTSYEGDYYITSSSSAANLQNFFIYNHIFKTDYENSSFSGISITAESGVTIGDLVYISDQYTVNAADADSFAKRAVGVLQSAGIIKWMTGLIRNVNTVGGGNIIPGDILYLSTTAGKVSRTSPSGSGQIQQRVGTAVSYESSGNVVDMIMHIDINPTIL